ncbi:MAG: alkaline phosphatase D family protein, partial [Candidatus Glassbacteria bacterium]
MKSKARFIDPVICLVLLVGISTPLAGADFRSDWRPEVTRYWIGPEYWSNPLPDWRLQGGRAECWRSGADRNVYLLTAELTDEEEGFVMEVTSGPLDSGGAPLSEGWVGFKVGLRGEFNDYRDTAIRGFGLPAGVTTEGRMFIGNPASGVPLDGWPLKEMRLRLEWTPSGGRGRLAFTVFDEAGSQASFTFRIDIHPGWLAGGVALVASSAPPYQADWTAKPHLGGMNPPYLGNQNSGGNACFWFRDWKLSGDKVVLHPDRAFGPILFTCYTLSGRTLKLTAQLAPVGNGSRVVYLQTREEAQDGWRTVGEEVIDPLARTATFRISGWDDRRETAYRVAYFDSDGDLGTDTCYYEGTVRHNPVEKSEIVVAVFTGNNDFGFPHADVVRHVRFHQPDLLVFTGDQIYEATGGYPTLRVRDVNLATLDYLRRWYMFGWEYRELLREVPSVALPDDHDMFQGNIWGAGGRPVDLSAGYAAGQDRGGYCMPPEWVDMVQRTQTSHLPDPFDPTPVEQGIDVYYTSLAWGGVSFAVIEDRKWKSSPTTAVPKGDIVNGWSHNPDYDAARDGDVPGAVLLGDRQLDFLRRWAADWQGGVWMKAVISQTLFANVCTLPPPARADEVVPTLAILPRGEHAKGDVLVQDHDSDGWPQTGRRLAVAAMRCGFAFHIAGDQHLGSTVQYGV